MPNFSRALRLVSKHEFKFVFDKPRKISRHYLQLLYRPNSLPHARVGVIVAKRVVRLAVSRNRLRRMVRESFRHHQHLLPGIDIVVMVRSACPIAASKVFREEIDQAWQALTN